MSRRALALFIAMSVIWGIPYLFIRVAVAEVSPAFLVFARTTMATAILLPLAFTRTDLPAVLVRWRWLVVFAAIEIGVPWLLLGSAEQKVPSSLAALLIAGTPLVGTMLAVATGRRDHVGRAGVLGLLLGVAGVAAIVGVNLDTADPIALVELGLVAVCYAVGPAILTRQLSGLPSLGVMALSLGLVAAVYAPVALVQWPAAVPSGAAIGSILVLGVVCTALAFIVFAALIAAVGPVRATVITFINPAVAAVLGVLVLQEAFTPAMAVGFGLVLAGSVLATRPPRPATETAMDVPAGASAT